MFKKLNGSALFGVLTAMMVIAVLVYGSSFFWPKSESTKEMKGGLESAIDTSNQVKHNLDDINQKINVKNELIGEILDIDDPSATQPDSEQAGPALSAVGSAGSPQDSGQAEPEQETGENKTESSSADTENWREVARENEGFKIKYHQDWYYTVNRREAAQDGYDMIIGFDEDSGIWEMLPPYPIELVIADESVEWLYGGYIVELGMRNNKKYILQTENQEAYKDILDKMAGSFGFIDEATASR